MYVLYMDSLGGGGGGGSTRTLDYNQHGFIRNGAGLDRNSRVRLR